MARKRPPPPPPEDPPSASSLSEESESEETNNKEEEENKKRPSSHNPSPTPTQHPKSSSDPDTKKNKKSKISHADEEKKKKKSKISNADEEKTKKKKSLIVRLWSEEDEIVILKRLIEYKSKTYYDMGLFHEFIKESVHVDVSKNQLMVKIRRLKKKYLENAKKGEKGADPVFSRPCEQELFELSKRLWGGGGSNAVGDDDKNSNKAREWIEAKNSFRLRRKDAKEVVAMGERLNCGVEGLKGDQEDFWSMYPRLQESLELDKSLCLLISGDGKNFVKEGMSMVGSVKAKELEEKWKSLRVAEVSLYLKRVELVREQTKQLLEAMKSSKS